MPQSLHFSKLVAAALCWACSCSILSDALASEQAREGIYVTNEVSGDVTVIDGASLRAVGTVKLGKRPRGLKISPSGKILFVALSGSPIVPPGADEASAPPPDKAADGIGVVDLRTLRLLRTLRGVSDPEQLAISRDGKRLYVASEDTASLHVLDVESGKNLAKLNVGHEPEGVTASPDGRLMCVTSEGDSTVSLVDTATNSVAATIEVGKRPRFCAFSPEGDRAYVSGELDASITVIDVRSRKTLQKITLTGENVRPMGIAVTADGKRLYATTGRGGTLVEIDTSTYRIERSVQVGPRPWNVALSQDGNHIYTANGPSNDVSVVDAKSFAVVRKISAGERPWGVIVAPLLKQ